MSLGALNPLEATIFINLDHFNRYKIMESLKKALSNLTCSNEGCNLSAKAVKVSAKEAL